jgi:hypothetical protein
MRNGSAARHLLGAALACALTGCAQPISCPSLIPEMTDLAALAEFANPPFTCKQSSSYDRASTTPALHTWFANRDSGHYLHAEKHHGRREFVMLDAQGPGAIVRIWSANPAGALRFYFDGADTPALKDDMAALLGGSLPNLPRPIAGTRGGGWNLYLPIPYAKSCKVTTDATLDKMKMYYHVNYRTYPAGTEVVSLTADRLSALGTELRSLAAQLAAPSSLNSPPAGAEKKTFDVTLAPGADVSLGTFAGPQAIRRFVLDWSPTGDRDEPALRAVVLTIAFDGETCVAAPLGDFFGAAPGINPFESLPLSVERSGAMICRWVMPFKQTAVIQARNFGDTPVPLKGEFAAAPYRWTAATMLFHAKWRSAHDLPSQPAFDWNCLAATGRGIFAGVSLAIDNPVNAWWGEGDEKIYVDGETFPSHFGTGTEDYFGYAWCGRELFSHAYHNQPRCDGSNFCGRTSVNRFQILDRIPFTRDFRFDMELWHWANCKVNLSAVGYWYALPGSTDNFRPIQADDVRLRAVKPPNDT